jgi:hypothetical protein
LFLRWGLANFTKTDLKFIPPDSTSRVPGITGL